MARTRTAPWDYEHIYRPADYNGICPICGSPAYDDLGGNGNRIITCPNCLALEKAAELARLDDLDMQMEANFKRFGY